MIALPIGKDFTYIHTTLVTLTDSVWYQLG